ncbi:hypothetical protein ACVWZR_008665 [Bradyrhizobium sp. i1.3.1]
MSDDAEVEKQGREAIEAFVTAVTYPVIWTDGSRIATLGSGVLFQHGERRFSLSIVIVAEGKQTKPQSLYRRNCTS